MRPIIAFFLLSCSSLVLADDKAANDKATVRVRVHDADGQAIANSKLKLFLWSGKWDPTEVSATSDAQGRAELVGIQPDNYATLVAQADGMATTALDLQLIAGEVREIQCELRQPISGSVRILDSQGTPLKGAVLSALQFIAGDGGSFMHRHGSDDPFPFEPTTSDAQGVIQLPPMPQGSKVNVVVFHPDFQPNRVDNLELVSGELATINLEKGVQLDFKYVLGAGLDAFPESLQINTNLGAQPDNRSTPGASLYLNRQLQSTSWHCTIAPAQYRNLYVSSRSDDFTITPRYSADDPNCAPLLNISDSQPHEFELLIRKNVKVRGQLTGYLEGLTAQSTAIGRTENLHPTLQIAVGDHRWVPASFNTVQADGTFELLLPPGPAKVSFGSLQSAIVEPREVEVTIEPGKELVLPEIKIRQLSPITGRLVDQQQRPIDKAIVRIHVGVWTSDYVTCDADGQFSLSPDLIVDTSRHSPDQIPVSILAFDPQSRCCAHVDISDTWQTAQNLTVECREQPKGWLLDAIRKQEQEFGQSVDWFRRRQETWEQRRQDYSTKFQTGSVGQPAPELDKGTWLNTHAQSLKDLRGKYVLLDFWFIGCGPCEVEIPDLKLTYERFGPERFSVVSVHVTPQTIENVRGFVQQKGMTYPVVVDNDEAEIENAYEQAGVQGYPSYILLGPDGRIVHNDFLSNDLSLSIFKAEIIWSQLQN